MESFLSTTLSHVEISNSPLFDGNLAKLIFIASICCSSLLLQILGLETKYLVHLPLYVKFCIDRYLIEVICLLR